MRNHMQKIRLKYIIGIFGLFTLLIRLFYFQLDELFGVRFLNFALIVILVSSLSLLILTIIKAIRKEFKPLLSLLIVISTIYFVPFEFLVGWTQFKSNTKERDELVNSLKNGTYDSEFQNPEYRQYGAWIENHKPRYKVYKDDNIQMIFCWQGHIRTHEEYCGQLYLSDIKQIENVIVGEFLGREYRKKYLGNNWFWVDCFIERTPGP